MRILNATQMREADRQTIDEVGIASLVLMENAGRQVVSAIEAAYDDRLSGRVAVLCGKGNNGGDGFVIARTLSQRGVDVSVFLLASVAQVKGDARVNLDILGRLGVGVMEVDDEQRWELHASEVQRCSLIVDAIVGTGLGSPLSGLLETVVADVNVMGIPIVSVDLPSGLSADTPHLLGQCVSAAMTVTLAAPKLSLVVPPGEDHAGDVVIADIGIPYEVIDALEGQQIELLTPEQVRLIVQPRPADSHKGDYGRVTVVAGSRGKSGAAHLAGLAALRSGAGLVTVATPASCLPVIASLAAEYTTESLAEGDDGQVAEAAVDAVLALRHDVIACGPGLGRGAAAGAFVRALVERSPVPLVLDADAILAFAPDPGQLVGRDERTIVITPHPGEMAQLVGRSIEDVQANRIEIAGEFAATHQVHVVLKGHRTVIASPSGLIGINPTGNPGMATGGTGDVLTGMIAAWLAQLLDPDAACRLAVFLHGAAGDLAAAHEGRVSMIASDLLQHIGPALEQLASAGATRDNPGKE
jgi:ADP-dependent NAD(P)H-hydrate dehydratase / NAD(P)H-hydrate epimerase